ncbi:MAG TPA: isochorismatase family protein [Stellaceae bacterium]|nr:isochorismatase family protein [Stellaceae bacterium]
MTLASRFLSLALMGGTLALGLPAQAADVVDSWAQVQAPPAPKLENVTVDAKSTALFMLDLLKQNCAPNPACMAALPGVKSLLDQARAKKMYVVYSKFPGPSDADVLPDVARAGKEPMITGFLDKFLKTNLDQLLKKNHIKTVIVVGNASNGAVLFTGQSAFALGYQLVVPVDGATSRVPYADQSTIYDFAAAPVMAGKVKLTRTNMITIQ